MDAASAPAAKSHLVQLYRDADEIGASVAAFLSDGLAAGRPAVVIATAKHRALFAERLRGSGWAPEELGQRGMLVALDAEETLAALMDAGSVSSERFDNVVGGVVERAAETAGGGAVSAYGEMVDVLWQRGDTEAAVELEGLWNRLCARRPLSLLCGYRVDIFDRTAQVSLLPQVCRAHGRMLPGHDSARIEDAVETALRETLGGPSTEKVYALIAAQERKEHIPTAQLALMWVSAHMPRAAERVLAVARANYSAPAPA